jgi:hypothetical protein
MRNMLKIMRPTTINEIEISADARLYRIRTLALVYDLSERYEKNVGRGRPTSRAAPSQSTLFNLSMTLKPCPSSIISSESDLEGIVKYNATPAIMEAGA